MSGRDELGLACIGCDVTPSGKNVELQGPGHMQIETIDQRDTGEHIRKKPGLFLNAVTGIF